MGNEIQTDYDSGNTLYAVIRDPAGHVWHVAGQTFEDWGEDGHTADDYDVPLIDKGGSHYVGDFNSNIPSGRYCTQVFVQVGANPADTDTLLTSQDIVWTGSGVLTATKMLTNKAVHDKVAGTFDYYDDDGQTILLTHTASDTVSTMTRTPE